MFARSAALVLVAVLAAACGQAPPSDAPGIFSPSAAPNQTATPPAVSDVALVEAIAVRNRFGLRADEAWIREVAADPATQVGIAEFGTPLTPAEYVDLMNRRWDQNLFEEVRAYGLTFPDEFAGAYINLKGSGVIIEFTGRLERHRRALANLAADPALVEVREVEWSLKELDEFSRQVESERAWFDSIGVRLLQVVHGVDENFVRAQFISPDEAIASVIEAHFGNPTWLKATWDGPPPWAGPRADLRIVVTDAQGRPVPNVECRLVSEDPRAPTSSAVLWGTGPTGICEIRNMPTVRYQVSLHEDVNNDHFDPDPVKEIAVVLQPGGTVVRVVIP